MSPKRLLRPSVSITKCGAPPARRRAATGAGALGSRLAKDQPRDVRAVGDVLAEQRRQRLDGTRAALRADGDPEATRSARRPSRAARRASPSSQGAAPSRVLRTSIMRADLLLGRAQHGQRIAAAGARERGRDVDVVGQPRRVLRLGDDAAHRAVRGSEARRLEELDAVQRDARQPAQQLVGRDVVEQRDVDTARPATGCRAPAPGRTTARASGGSPPSRTARSRRAGRSAAGGAPDPGGPGTRRAPASCSAGGSGAAPPAPRASAAPVVRRSPASVPSSDARATGAASAWARTAARRSCAAGRRGAPPSSRPGRRRRRSRSRPAWPRPPPRRRRRWSGAAAS